MEKEWILTPLHRGHAFSCCLFTTLNYDILLLLLHFLFRSQLLLEVDLTQKKVCPWTTNQVKLFRNSLSLSRDSRQSWIMQTRNGEINQEKICVYLFLLLACSFILDCCCWCCCCDLMKCCFFLMPVHQGLRNTQSGAAFFLRESEHFLLWVCCVCVCDFGDGCTLFIFTCYWLLKRTQQKSFFL